MKHIFGGKSYILIYSLKFDRKALYLINLVYGFILFALLFWVDVLKNNWNCKLHVIKRVSSLCLYIQDYWLIKLIY